MATAIITVSAFALISPLARAQATSTLSPIPAPSSCTYVGHPASPISQTMAGTTVGLDFFTVTKHAEKEIYNCIISGSTKHYILDTTTWTTVFGGPIKNAFEECAKDPATGMIYSCQTEPVGNKLAPTSACTQLSLGFPQHMNTLAADQLTFTMESQKEIFKCSTPNGPVIQEVIIWTDTLDNTATGGSESTYSVETCQKPVTITTGLPLLSCTAPPGFTALLP